MTTKETYKVDCDCSNCDKSVSVELPKGTPVSQNMECPNCGCMAASKRVDFDKLLPAIPRIEPYHPPAQPLIRPLDWDYPATVTFGDGEMLSRLN